MLGSREGDGLSDIKQAIHCVCLNEHDNKSNGGDTSNVDDLLEGNQSKPSQKCLGKCASFPSAEDVAAAAAEIETSLRWLFFEDSVPSPCSCSIPLPTPLKLVSALKGSREKRGLPTKILRVTWSPDVYDPQPTSVLHTVRGKKLHKSKKGNDKKRNGKKVQKANSSRRGSSKDNKQFRRSNMSSDKWYNYKPLEVHVSANLDGFKVGSSTDPFCGTSFLKKSPTRVHYSVAEAL